MVSIIIVTYRSGEHISMCLDSLRSQTYAPVEVIVYDNASPDGTPSLVRSQHPEVQLIEGQENIGFAAANNCAAKLAHGEFLAFLNPDTIVEPDWLVPLIKVLESDQTIGAVTPQLVFAQAPDMVNTCGNEVHFSGITYCREFGAPVSEKNPVEVGAISGAAFVIRKRLFDDLGGFESSFFLYYEDTDLSFRIRCAGLRCMAVYGSKVRHDYRSSFNSSKIFYLERNRYLSLLSLVPWPVLILMLPALVLMELASWGYCFQQGNRAVSAKTGSWLDLFQKRHWIMARRRQQRSCSAYRSWPSGAFSARLQVQYVNRQSQIVTRLLEGIGWLLAKPMLSLVQAIWG